MPIRCVLQLIINKAPLINKEIANISYSVYTCTCRSYEYFT